MSTKSIGEAGLTYLWTKIKAWVNGQGFLTQHQDISGKADKIQEISHGTSDTTFTLTPNVMHIWGTVTTLTLSLPTDSNSILDEYMFTFTSGSTPTTLSLPSAVKWVQDIEVEANKTYQVSIINNLAGWLTNGMPSGGGSGGGGENNIIESISVNGVEQPVSSKNVNLQFKTINNNDITGTGNITIQGGSGGEENVIEVVKVNGSALTPDANKAVDVTVPTESTVSGWGFTKNAGTITGITMNGSSKGTSGVVNLGTVITSETALSKGTTTGSGNAVTDLSVSGHTITLTKGSTFLTSETSLSKGTTTGSGNAVTDLSVSGHTITLTKGTTFLTSSDVVTIYSGSSAPSSGTGSNGDIYIQTS